MNRTLLAYEQFCEEYSNYSKLSRTYLKNNQYPVIAPNDHLDDGRYDKLITAARARHDVIGTSRAGDLPMSVRGRSEETRYPINKRELDKLRMKRDPEYREKRLAEIADRKERNRSKHDAGNLVKRLKETLK